jgi:hypothetical protein
LIREKRIGHDISELLRVTRRYAAAAAAALIGRESQNMTPLVVSFIASRTRIIWTIRTRLSRKPAATFLCRTGIKDEAATNANGGRAAVRSFMIVILSLRMGKATRARDIPIWMISAIRNKPKNASGSKANHRRGSLVDTRAIN